MHHFSDFEASVCGGRLFQRKFSKKDYPLLGSGENFQRKFSKKDYLATSWIRLEFTRLVTASFKDCARWFGFEENLAWVWFKIQI